MLFPIIFGRDDFLYPPYMERNFRINYFYFKNQFKKFTNGFKFIRIFRKKKRVNLEFIMV